MHYYQHNIGDYLRDTHHLSLVEHGAYRQLIDLYYLHEGGIPKETNEVFRRLRAITDDEKNAVVLVLNEFFFCTENGWKHARCDAEIAAYQAKAGRARDNGKLGGRPKKTNGVIFGNLEKTQTKPREKLTNNQEPITNNQEPVITPLPPEGVKTADAMFDAFWKAYPKKVGKGAARKSWDHVKRPAESLELILAALAWQVLGDQWMKDNGQYIPNPATYLNQQRWLDERPIAVVKSLTAVGQKSAESASRWLDAQGFRAENAK